MSNEFKIKHGLISQGDATIYGNINVTGLVDDVDIAALETSYSTHNHSGIYIEGITPGSLISTSGTTNITIGVDLSKLTDMTAAILATDEMVVLDAGAQRRKSFNEIPLSIFNNDVGFITSETDSQTLTWSAGSLGITGGNSVTIDGRYGELATTNTWSAKQTFSGNIDVGTSHIYAGALDEVDIYNNGTMSYITSSDPLIINSWGYSAGASAGHLFPMDNGLTNIGGPSNHVKWIYTDGIATDKILNLMTNGFVKTSGSDGTLSIDTATYSLSSHNHSGVYEPIHSHPYLPLAGGEITGNVHFGDADIIYFGAEDDALITWSDRLYIQTDGTTTKGITIKAGASDTITLTAGGVSWYIGDGRFYSQNANEIGRVSNKVTKLWAADIHTTKISNLTSNGFVKTSGSDGTLSVDTATYSLSNHNHSGVYEPIHSHPYLPLTGGTLTGDLVMSSSSIVFDDGDYVPAISSSDGSKLTLSSQYGLMSNIDFDFTGFIYNTTYLAKLYVANGLMLSSDVWTQGKFVVFDSNYSTGQGSSLSGGYLLLKNSGGAGVELNGSTTGELGVSGHIAIGDLKRLYLGGSKDLELYHDGASSFVENNTGVLNITSSGGVKIGNLTSNGFVKTSGSDGTLSVDTSTYLTGNQTITLSGDVTGTGTTSITTTVVNDSHTHDTRYYTETEMTNRTITPKVNSFEAKEIILTDSSGVAKFKIIYNETEDSLDTIKL